MLVKSIQIYESEFGGSVVDLSPAFLESRKNARRYTAELTRDAFIYGGFENAIKAKIEKAVPGIFQVQPGKAEN